MTQIALLPQVGEGLEVALGFNLIYQPQVSIRHKAQMQERPTVSRMETDGTELEDFTTVASAPAW